MLSQVTFSGNLTSISWFKLQQNIYVNGTLSFVHDFLLFGKPEVNIQFTKDKLLCISAKRDIPLNDKKSKGSIV